MYCITLRSRTDARITGWYDGSCGRWSTDHKRRQLFEKKRDAARARQELCELCPRNAKLINIEPADVAADSASVESWHLPAERLDGAPGTRPAAATDVVPNATELAGGPPKTATNSRLLTGHLIGVSAPASSCRKKGD